jgi:cupin 2 domain-containing protein
MQVNLMKIFNIFSDIPKNLPQEQTQELLRTHQATIERIVSRGHCSAKGFWYDQHWDEWVLLLSGKAGIEFKEQSELTQLGPGDCLLIPAHVQHRVAWTEPHADTLWLVVHLDRDG